MFFFYFILIILILSTFLVVFTTIEIHIKNLKFSTDKISGKYFNKDYNIIVKLKLFDKINFAKINIKEVNLENQKMQMRLDKIQKKIKENKNKFDVNLIKAIKYAEIKSMNLIVNISLEDAALNAIAIGLISTVVAINLRKVINENNKVYWKITPLYQNKNLLNVNFDGIFKVKVLHIIYTILNMKGEQNDRTSNRRAYAYSHE